MENYEETNNPEQANTEEEGLLSRRGFFDSLGKWSKIVIGATVLGGSLFHANDEAHARGAWANRGGGGGGGAWANRGGGGGGWANRSGGSAGWANRGGGSAVWANRGSGWANRGGSWVNRY